MMAGVSLERFSEFALPESKVHRPMIVERRFNIHGEEVKTEFRRGNFLGKVYELV